MKKTYKGAFPLILSAFFLIFWDIWRIRTLFTQKPDTLNIITSVIMIIFFLLLAYRSFHLYMDFLTIEENTITIAGLIRDKHIKSKEILSIQKVGYSMVIKLKTKETISIRLKDFNKKYKDEIENILINFKKRK